jgi:type VI secretion system protein ImpK
MPTALADPPSLTSHDLRFDAAAPRLAELFAPVLTLIVQLRSTDDYGDAERLRQRIRDLFAEAEGRARSAGVPSEDVQDAAFALVAFLDEAVLSSEWPERGAWLSRPLQLERFERYDAGEAFFDRLRALLGQPHRAEVLEVYYLAMALGFRGQYQLHGQNELRGLIASAHAALEPAAALAPRGVPRGEAAAEVRASIPPWVFAAAAAVVALIVYIGMSLYMSSAAASTARALGALGG